MNRKTVLYLCLLFLFISTESLVYAAPEAVNFSHISINSGLSQSTVFSIAQDKSGNMWFATYDGINKYDGYSFTVYRHESTAPNSIANDIAKVIKMDSKGTMWIGTRDGLSCYDEQKDVFKNFSYEVNGNKVQVNAIEEMQPGLLMIGTDNGLTMFDTNQMRFLKDKLRSNVKSLIPVCLVKSNEYIYIGTGEGLFQYHIAKQELSPLTQALKGKKIQSVLKQSGSRLWVATEGDGLYLINPITKAVANYRHETGNSKSISSNYIRSLALDTQNRLWIGTFNDLNIYKEASDSFDKYSYDPMNVGSLSQNSIRSIFLDAQGGMWLGTYFGGLNYYHPL
ncbi:MAG: two-component regulator propeller domain-containing protein, partial [Bacteroides sp.]